MYYVAVEGHKRKRIDVDWKHFAAVLYEKQIIENMQDGIVSKEEFMKAQKLVGKAMPNGLGRGIERAAE